MIGYSEDSRERRARAVADVVSVDQRKLSVGRTTAAIVGATASIIVVTAAVALASVLGDWNATPAPHAP